MKKLAQIIVLISIVAGTAHADFWSKLVNVKTVDNSPRDQYEYGRQVGSSDAYSRPGYDGRISERSKADHHYNRGYERGYREAQFEQGGVFVIERPRVVYEQQVIIVEPRNNGYDEVPHFELFQ